MVILSNEEADAAIEGLEAAVKENLWSHKRHACDVALAALRRREPSLCFDINQLHDAKRCAELHCPDCSMTGKRTADCMRILASSLQLLLLERGKDNFCKCEVPVEICDLQGCHCSRCGKPIDHKF